MTELLAFIKKLIMDGYYGKLIIHFKAGDITHWESQQTHKPGALQNK
jgi:hypothetical protein